MFVAAVVISGVLACVFFYSGGRKVLAGPAMVEEAARLGLPAGGYRLVGVAELAGAVGLVAGLVWAPLGVAAAVGLALLMVGAVISHLRVGDPPAAWAVPVGIGVVAVAGLVVRVGTL